MGRRKGSKNRSTLTRKVCSVIVNPTPQKVPDVVVPRERTIIDPENAKRVIAETRHRLQIMVEYYTADTDIGLPGEGAFIPERIQEYLRSKVFFAESTTEALVFAQRAVDKLHTHLMALWSDKRIFGPNTRENIDAKARKIIQWAKRLESLGRTEDAARQMAKAMELERMPLVKGIPW